MHCMDGEVREWWGAAQILALRLRVFDTIRRRCRRCCRRCGGRMCFRRGAASALWRWTPTQPVGG